MCSAHPAMPAARRRVTHSVRRGNREPADQVEQGQRREPDRGDHEDEELPDHRGTPGNGTGLIPRRYARPRAVATARRGARRSDRRRPVRPLFRARRRTADWADAGTARRRTVRAGPRERGLRRRLAEAHGAAGRVQLAGDPGVRVPRTAPPGTRAGSACTSSPGSPTAPTVRSRECLADAIAETAALHGGRCDLGQPQHPGGDGGRRPPVRRLAGVPRARRLAAGAAAPTAARRGSSATTSASPAGELLRRRIWTTVPGSAERADLYLRYAQAVRAARNSGQRPVDRGRRAAGRRARRDRLRGAGRAARAWRR